MASLRFYLTHGSRLDSEHPTIELAEGRAYDLINTYGRNHSEIKIGDRHSEDENNVVLIYYCKKEYPVRNNREN
jgi:hypothetical protein